mgnify:FL=1
MKNRDCNGKLNKYMPQNADLSHKCIVGLPFAANGRTGTLPLEIVGDLNSSDETLKAEITGQDTAILVDGDRSKKGLFSADG